MSFLATHLVGFGAQRASVASDPYTSLLLHGDGTNGSTTFTDSSSYGHSVTVTGDTIISTTQSKFGGASMHFPGSADRLNAPNDASLQFGSGDFTIDLWVYVTSAVQCDLLGWRNSSAFCQVLLYLEPNSVRALCSTDNATWSINFASSSTISLNTWTHVAFERNGSSFRLYFDGTSVGSATASITLATPVTGMYLAGDGLANDFTGYIDEVRVSKGIARYGGSNFTPESAAYAA